MSDTSRDQNQSFNGTVVSVNVASERGTSKKPVLEIRIDEQGVVGDAHHGEPLRQVSLLAAESIEAFSQAAGRPFAWGDFAENITTRGIEFERVAPLDRFVSGSLELEVTQIGKKCHGGGCAIFREVGQCVMPREGVFCRVLRGGTVKSGDAIALVPKVFRFRAITLSDRASKGIYQDESGPRLKAHLESSFAQLGRNCCIETDLLPDDAERLRSELEGARDNCVDAVFTTGSTGIGPRDIAPDVVTALADKTIPGIMEHIRVKSGADLPAALLSRSVAAVLGPTLVYTLPGSVKAVDEYMGEILKTLVHSLYMVQGLDTH